MVAEAPHILPAVDAAQLLDLLTTAVIVVDERSRVLQLNVAAEDLLAVGQAAACGRRMSDLLLGGDRLESLIVRARVSGEALAHGNGSSSRQGAATRDTSWTGGLHAARPCRRAGMRTAGDRRTPPPGTHQPRERAARPARRQPHYGQAAGARDQEPAGAAQGAAQLLERELPDESLRIHTRHSSAEADRLHVTGDSLSAHPPVVQGVGQCPRAARSRLPAGSPPRLQGVLPVVATTTPSLPPLDLDPRPR